MSAMCLTNTGYLQHICNMTSLTTNNVRLQRFFRSRLSISHRLYHTSMAGIRQSSQTLPRAISYLTTCEHWRRSESQSSGSHISCCMSIIAGFCTILKRARLISQTIHCISVKLLEDQPRRARRQSARHAISSASSRLP